MQKTENNTIRKSIIQILHGVNKTVNNTIIASIIQLLRAVNKTVNDTIRECIIQILHGVIFCERTEAAPWPATECGVTQKA